MLGQTNFDKALTPELRARAKLAVRDEYTFDFLELGEEHAERELERVLVARVEHFLRAMGCHQDFRRGLTYEEGKKRKPVGL